MMKRFAIGLLASSLLAVAVPAAADDGAYSSRYRDSGVSITLGYGYDNRWDNGWSSEWNRGGRDFRRELDHLYAAIEHGVRDRSFSQWEARRFYVDIQNLRRMERAYRLNDGRLSPWERRELERRMRRLHATVDAAHRDGHDRDDHYDDDRYGDDRDGWRR